MQKNTQKMQTKSTKINKIGPPKRAKNATMMRKQKRQNSLQTNREKNVTKKLLGQ